MSDSTAARVDEMAARSTHAVRLASLVSFAVLVEPALLRAARLELLPAADAGVEADLWFGPLVQSRGRDGILLFPEVAETLRSKLSESLAERCWRLTERLHRHLPPAVQLEERLNWLALKPQDNASEIQLLLGSALAALLDKNRTDVANWLGRALPRMPPMLRNFELAVMLAAASDLRLGREWRLSEYLDGGQIPAWFASMLPDTIQQVELGIAATSSGVVINPVPSSGEQHIRVPATNPVVLQLLAGDRSQLVFIEPSRSSEVPMPFDNDTIEITTLAGDVFTFAIQEASSSLSSRIFIAYSRKDGAEFAADLRQRLVKEKLSVWQDLTALEGGHDWWSQIEDALKSKALDHFVLVVSAPRDQARPSGGQDRLARQGAWPQRPQHPPALAGSHLRPRCGRAAHEADPGSAGPKHAEAGSDDGAGPAGRFRAAASRVRRAQEADPRCEG
jgi:hypothetical protein